MTDCNASGVPRYDAGANVSCVQRLMALRDAYYALVSGETVVEIRHGERWLTYRQGNVEGLRMAYQTLYAQCPDAAAAGLESLNPGLRVHRGPARRNRLFFSRY